MSTIVLVGGSFLGAWAWERVTPILAAHHDVHPLTLTGFGDRAHLGSAATTLGTHATDIVAAIEFAGLRDVVLVAHSYAGAPATVAAGRIPDRIARIVYVAATIPQAGKSLFDILPPGAEEAIMRTVEDGLIPVLGDEVLDANFGRHGLTSGDRAWLRARGTGQPVNTYRDPAPAVLSAVDGIPRTYVACSGDPGDPATPPGHDLVTLDSGHWPMISRPAELAGVIDKAARS